jgi:hypothetical protein
MAKPLPPLPSGATLVEDRPTPPPAPRADSSMPPLPSGATMVSEPGLEPEGLIQKAAPYVKGTLAAGTVGALAPEILTGTGMIAATTPFTAPAAPYLLGAGQAARGSRLASALTTAGGYIGGEAAYKATPEPEKTLFQIPGVNVSRGEAARFMGEVVAPGALSLTKQYIVKSPFVRAIVAMGEERGTQTASNRAAVSELANFRNRVPVNQLLNTERLRLSPNDIRSYEIVVQRLQQADSNTKQRIAIDIANAQDAADKVLKQYADRAEQVVKTNRDLAQRIINEGDRRAKEIQDAALAEANRKLRVRGRAQQAGQVAETMPETTLGRVGKAETFEADTGSTIQQRINNVVSQEQKALNDAYKTDKKIADALVASQESKGVSVTSTPAYKNISDYLDKKLNLGAFENSPFLATTEPTLVASLTNIRNSIKSSVKNVVNEQGVVTQVKVPPSFEALDQVRRKLGDVFAGKDVEGFKNISREQAQELYGLVRAAQVEYAGGKNGAFDMLLRNYAEDKALLNALKIPTGKKIIAKDLINPEYFTYDPSGLAREFFSTRKKVQDLFNLTKDPAFVEQQASNHVARTIKGMDATKLKDYIDKNGEWLDLMPNLRNRLQDHYAAVVRSGSVTPKTRELSKSLKTEIKALPETGRVEAGKVKAAAAKEAEDVVKAGKKEAKQLTAEGQAKAKELKPVPEKFVALIGAGDPVVQIRKLITEGNTEKLRRAAPFITSNRQVAAAFKQAVRQELSQLDPRTLAGGRNVRGEWETKIRPALEATGLIDAKLAKEVSERLRTAQLVMEPNQAVNASLYVLRQLAAGQLGGAFSQ